MTLAFYSKIFSQIIKNGIIQMEKLVNGSKEIEKYVVLYMETSLKTLEEMLMKHVLFVNLN